MPKTKVMLMIGLPGSGKSTLGKKLALEQGAILFDDPRDQLDLNEIKQVVESQRDCIITDPFLCRPRDLALAQQLIRSWGAEITCYFFENNPEKAYWNTQRRQDDRKVTQMIKNLTAVYQIPEGEPVLPIYSQDQDHGDHDG